MDIFFVLAYQTLLDNFGRFISQRFLHDEVISKKNWAFKFYVKTIKAYIHTLKKLEERGRPFAVRLQERRLRKILNMASETIWWQAHFKKNNISINKIKTVADLQLIPPVNRFDLIEIPKKDLLRLAPEDPSIVWRRTGGSTTGAPFVWGLNKTVMIVNVLSRLIREAEERGFRLDQHADRNFYMELNYATGSPRSEFKWFSRGDFFLQGNDSELNRGVEEISRVIMSLGGGVLRTNPLNLSFLVQELKERNMFLNISLCTMAGQRLEEHIRALALKHLGCQTMVHYGMQETGALAIECKTHHGFYHVFPERAIIEIVNDKGCVVPPGTIGNITVTCLDNTVMPLIRYQPRDIGVLHYDLICQCKNASPLLEIKSRTTDFIKFSNGEGRPVGTILRKFNHEPFLSNVRRVQVRQEKLDEVRILLEVRQPIDEGSINKLKKEIMRVYNRTPLGVSMEQVNAIHQEGRKFQVFVPL